MPFYEDEKTALFIDGTSLYQTTRGLGVKINFIEMLNYFDDRTKLVTANYYSVLSEGDRHNPAKPLTDFLSYNGYRVLTKTVREYTDTNGRFYNKDTMNTEIVVDMMEMAPRMDHIVLFSGNADFKRVVESVQRQGVKVSVVSSIETNDVILSDELRRQCNNFVDLWDIVGKFKRAESKVNSFDKDNDSDNEDFSDDEPAKLFDED